VTPIIGLVATLAPTIGPTVGGYLTDLASWHWCFPESTFQLTRCFVENFQTCVLDKFREGTWLLLTEHRFELRPKAPYPVWFPLCRVPAQQRPQMLKIPPDPLLASQKIPKQPEGGRAGRGDGVLARLTTPELLGRPRWEATARTVFGISNLAAARSTATGTLRTIPSRQLCTASMSSGVNSFR
jgi:MFS family permease